jgi:RNA polymerase sigma-70 factor (ECF subfamily)
VFTLTLTRSILMTDDHSELDGLRRLDSKAVEAFYDRYYPEIYRYVCYRLDDETLSEDIASEVFIRFLEAGRRQRGPETNLRGWLFSTANHVVNDHLRHWYRHPFEQLDENHASNGPAPAEEVEHREHTCSLQVALAALTTGQQHVLALRFGQDFSLEETAAVMKKNVNAVKQLQLRALAALVRQMAKKL